MCLRKQSDYHHVAIATHVYLKNAAKMNSIILEDKMPGTFDLTEIINLSSHQTHRLLVTLQVSNLSLERQ